MVDQSRRLLLQSALAGAGVLAAPGLLATTAPRPKRILILGGTGFIGPHTVRTAVARGHEVTIFTRGRKQVDLPEAVERLVGDRNDDHEALKGRTWDVVLDNNCYDYRWARTSTELLKDATDHYLLVSSLSSYAMPDSIWNDAETPLARPLPEDAPLVTRPADWKDGDEADYAWMKVLSEQIVSAAFPDRSTIVRPTLIVGPGDHTGRWSYWPMRFQRGGEILAPGNPEHAVQIIDQRDLTEWHVHLAENGIFGTFSGAGPRDRLSMGTMLEQVGELVDSPWSLTWADEAFLQEQGIQPWSDMPAWVPNYPMTWVDVSASVAAGLRYRSIADTARATLAFENQRGPDNQARPFTLTPERESEALAAWAARAVG
ncbi:MAG: NAD-dependent epimerase/dehydratase family protein [Pseudomonadota bacterium]